MAPLALPSPVSSDIITHDNAEKGIPSNATGKATFEEQPSQQHDDFISDDAPSFPYAEYSVPNTLPDYETIIQSRHVEKHQRRQSPAPH